MLTIDLHLLNYMGVIHRKKLHGRNLFGRQFKLRWCPNDVVQKDGWCPKSEESKPTF